MSIENRRTMQIVSALAAAVGFIFLPWIFNSPGIQWLLNIASAPSINLTIICIVAIALATIGMFAGLRDSRFKWSPVVLLVALMLFYISVTQNSLLKFGNFSFLGLGFWVTLIGSLLGIAVIIITNRKHV